MGHLHSSCSMCLVAGFLYTVNKDDGKVRHPEQTDVTGPQYQGVEQSFRHLCRQYRELQTLCYTDYFIDNRMEEKMELF
jgi:hypothetical protein